MKSGKKKLLYKTKIAICFILAIYVGMGCPFLETEKEEEITSDMKYVSYERNLPQVGESFNVKKETAIIFNKEHEEIEEPEIVSVSLNELEEKDLMQIAMAEAGTEDVKGKALVMKVVLNRVENEKFPNEVSEVIRQKGQFSPVRSGRFDSVVASEECEEALNLIEDGWDESNGALYFESNGKSGWHQRNLDFLYKYGNHYFYKEWE